jgi:hypothetical protein
MDEDGDSSDWLELYNNGTTVVDLTGWALTNDMSDPSMWLFPTITLEPKGFMVVFCSGKNRTVVGQPLHTNFNLTKSGGTVALIRPDGTISTEFNPFPAQYSDKSYGTQQTVADTNYLSSAGPLKYLVPLNNSLGTSWTAPAFNDSSWTSGINGIGFEQLIPGWLFQTWFANGAINTEEAAEAVIVTATEQTAFYQQTMAVVNWDDNGPDGNFNDDLNPPWLGGVGHDEFVVVATGNLTVPAAGSYTFGINSDDGCLLQIGPLGGSLSTVLKFDGLRAPGDTLGTYTFPAAGTYQIRAVMFQNQGGAEGEVYASAVGGKTTFDSTFRLVGDTANGGLAVNSAPASTLGDYSAFIRTNVQTPMLNVSPSIYLRYYFTVPNPGALTSLSMPIRYDDGFIAYLNGVKIAQRNAPSGVPTNTTAAALTHSKVLAALYETIDLTPFIGSLVTGTNVLAIQGLNSSGTDGSFLIQPEIDSYQVTSGGLDYFFTPTPAAFNTTTVYNVVGPVTVSLTHGFYSSPQTVTLTCGTPGATIRYTLDGSSPYERDVNGGIVRDAGGNAIPSPTSGIYTLPFTVSQTTTLRVAAFYPAYDPSPIVTQTYIFTADVVLQEPNGAPPVIQNPPGASVATTTWPTDSANSNNGNWSGWTRSGQTLLFGMNPAVIGPGAPYQSTIIPALQAIPSFSLVTDLPFLFDPTIGIYVNAYDQTIDWERPASLELINPDGTPGFQVDCGIRIRGGASRSPVNPKHAWRIFFRDSYGASALSYPFFGAGVGAQTFEKFDIRNAENYSWSFEPEPNATVDTYVKDEFNRDTQLAMGEISSHGGFYHLYVNGQYWGLENFDERPEADFGATYLGGSAKNFDTIKVDPETNYEIYATDGDFGLPQPGDPNDPQQIGRGWYRLWTRADLGLSSTNTVAQNNAVYQELMGNNPDGTSNPNYPVLLDAVNLADYNLCIQYGGNLDAAISNFLNNQRPNNWFGIRDETGASGGFKFILHDSEHTFLDPNENRFGPWPAGNSSQPSAISGVSQVYFSSPQYIWQQLLNSPEFVVLFADRVEKFCFNNGVCTPGPAIARFTARTALIDQAIIGESARWGAAQNPTAYTRADWLNACANVVNNVLPYRTADLIAQFRQYGVFPSIDTAVFNQRGGSVGAGFLVTLSNPNSAPAGQIIYYTTDGSDPRLYGGAVSPTAHVYSAPIPINASQTIQVRIKSATEWSALDAATFYPAQNYTGLEIVQLNYHPSVKHTEFIQFQNTSSSSMDVGGLVLTTLSGVSYTFPTGTTLAAGAYYLIVEDASAFAAQYPTVTPNAAYTGTLSHAADTITLSTALGGVIFSFTYGDRAPWPAAADGNGFTLVLINPGSNPNLGNPASWRASTNPGGSPGGADPVPPVFPSVFVNEALTRESGPLTDSIELYNAGTTPANISYWWLTDDHNKPQLYQIPNGTVIPAGGYVVFNESNFNNPPSAKNSFALSASGEEVYLFSGNAAGNITGYSHGFAFQASEDNVTFGRYLNSVGTESFPRQISMTLGAQNSGPLVGPLVINEIQYDPYAGYDQYIEIKNISASPVQLYDPANVTDTWQIEELGYNFPQNISLAAGALALVVPIDPATFRVKYNVPAATQIFGPYIGALSPTGQRVTLAEPSTPDTSTIPPTVPYIVIDSVQYGNAAPWPAAAGGSGSSLQRLNASAYADDPANWYADGITPGVDNHTNQPPLVSLITPANNATFTLPATIALSANASDPDGTIQKVLFYDGSIEIGEVDTAPYVYNWTNVSPGPHLLTARALDNGFAVTVTPPVSITVNPPGIGNGTGLSGAYYNDVNQVHLTGTATVRTDPTVDLEALYTPPAGIGGSSLTEFSTQWTGQIMPLYSASYTISTNSDDGVRVYLSGTQVINDWNDHPATIDAATLTLTAGQLYDINVQYYQNGGGYICQLLWQASGAGLAQQIIPQSQMYPSGSKPIIISAPQSQTVEQGSNVSFSVFASGDNDTYQWLWNNVPISGATSAALVVQQVIQSQAGSYSVVVTNTNGSTTSASAALAVTFTDSDGDGIPDSWMIQYFGHPTGEASDLSLAGDDADGTGLTNLQKYLAGLNPLNPASTFTAQVAPNHTGAGYTVTFTANSQRSYTVQYENSLATGAWQKLQDISPAVGTRTITVTDTAARASRFYRVVAPSQ